MKYLFFTGAPGSKWSSVVKNIYWSDSLDHSDYSEARTYWHDADTPGELQLMHLGAYWDPMMEFGSDWDYFDVLDKEKIINDFNKPFAESTKTKLIKSHIFANHLNKLKTFDCPIVLVYRNDIECLDWWKKCGEFSITYPDYSYYRDLITMWTHIKQQNNNIQNFIYHNYNKIHRVYNNSELIDILGINEPKEFVCHNYQEKDIQVYVYKN